MQDGVLAKNISLLPCKWEKMRAVKQYTVDCIRMPCYNNSVERSGCPRPELLFYTEDLCMSWNLEEALDYYRRQGAATDQNTLIALLKEIQRELGAVPVDAPAKIAEAYGLREPLVLALIRRIPSLRLSGGHCMELCAGPNCGKSSSLADYAEEIAPKGVTVKRVGCMRLCGKGPNLRWDGKLYQRVDQALIRRLMEQK